MCSRASLSIMILTAALIVIPSFPIAYQDLSGFQGFAKVFISNLQIDELKFRKITQLS